MIAATNLPKRQLQLEQLSLTGNALATRAAAALSLTTFSETFYPGWVAGDFHEFLARKLQDCLARKIRRLCISLPAQHGKSRLASVNFPAWALTKHPTLRFFQAGHTAELSKGFSREARSLVQSDRYLQLFPALVNPNVNRQDYWETKLGGYYYATSVCSGGTGVPADVVILDDPHKNFEEASSATIRASIWSWITAVALTRLSPDGILIVVQNRWHEDDVIGRFTAKDRVQELIEAGYADMNFEVIKLEAICENPDTDPMRRKFGEPLWPEVRTTAMLAAKKIEVGPQIWQSLYQQRPNRTGGNLVDTAAIKIIERDQVPADLVEMRGWDLALTVDERSDYSVGAKGGVHRYQGPNGKWVKDFYLTHIHRGKQAWPTQKQIILNLINQEAIGGTVGLETVGAFKIAAAELKESLQGKCMIKSINVHRDKAARANPWMSLLQGGRFYMVRAPWNRDFIAELEQFPNGVHDDQIDGVSVLWETVDKKNVLLVA